MISKSALLIKNNFPLKITNLKIGELKKGQVLVKILYSGFCSSQYGEIIGIKGEDKYLPHCMGHEACGIIVKKSVDVKKFKIKDLVVCHWMKSDGRDCEKIEYKDMSNRTINSGQITTFNQYSIISNNRLTKITKNKYNLKYLPLMGCSIPVGISTAEKILKVKKNKKILILGAGALGLPITHFCKILKLKFIDVVDKNKQSLKKAKIFGAKRVFDNINSPEILNSLNQNEYDYIVDTTASSKILNKIVSFNINCKIAFLGVPKKSEQLRINTLKINYGLKLLGSYGGNYQPEKDLSRYLNYLLKTKFPFKSYIYKTYKLSEINKLIKDYKKGKIIGKSLIKM